MTLDGPEGLRANSVILASRLAVEPHCDRMLTATPVKTEKRPVNPSAVSKNGAKLVDLTHEEVIRILELVQESDIEYLEVQFGELRLVASKTGDLPDQGQAPVTSSTPADVVAEAPHDATSPTRSPVTAVPQDLDGIITVTAPMVGVFYSAPSPDQPEFVTLGSSVEIGSTLGLIEVMKVFNSVVAEVAGEVVDVLARNEEFVEFGQPLFRIRNGIG